MLPDYLKHIKPYATYSEIYNMKHSKETLIEFIESLSLGGILQVLSQITFFDLNNTEIKNIICHFLYEMDKMIYKERSYSFEKLKELLGEFTLYSPQGLLTLWKWVLAYGKKNNLSEEIEINRGIAQVIYLSLIVSDYLDEHLFESETTTEEEIFELVNYEIIRNIVFNTNVNIGSSIARAKYIYIDLAKNKKLYTSKEYIDFNSKFEEKYGYSIEEYLVVLVGILAAFNKKRESIEANWSKSFSTYFKKTSLANIAEEIVDSLTLDFKTASKWCKESLEFPWKFILFKSKPLFRLNDNVVLPISHKLLQETLFEGLFHKIRSCYSYDDLSFNTFFGRPFEIYLSHIMEEAVNISPIKYKIIPEFEYNKEIKKSPDVMLRLGDKLLVIEGKSKRMKLNAIEGDDKASIDQAVENIILEPLKQAYDRVEEILNSNNVCHFNGVTDIYIMTVSMSGFPIVSFFEERIREELSNYFKVPIKGFYYIDIEEYELFCNLIGRKAKKQIFSILENKYTKYKYHSFKNFLIESHLPCKRPAYIQKKGIDFLNKSKKRLFSEDQIKGFL